MIPFRTPTMLKIGGTGPWLEIVPKTWMVEDGMFHCTYLDEHDLKTHRRVSIGVSVLALFYGDDK